MSRLDSVVLKQVPMARLRQLLRLALEPVHPRAEFRQWLKTQLLADSARLSQSRRRAGWLGPGGSLLKPGRREILIGAALGSAVSLAGLIALLIHVRLSAKEVTSKAA